MSQDVDMSQLHFTLLPSSDRTGPGTWVQILPPYVATVQSDVGPIDAVRIIVSDNLIYHMQLLFPTIKTVETGFVKLESTALKTMLGAVLPSSGYAFCSGISKKDYDDIFAVLRYDPKHLRKTQVGNQERVDANTCQVWFHTTAGYTLQEDRTLISPMCAPCKQLMKRMKDAAQSAILVSPEERSKRVQPDSHFPITQLSPASQKLRKQLQRKEKQTLIKKLSSAQQRARESCMHEADIVYECLSRYTLVYCNSFSSFKCRYCLE